MVVFYLSIAACSFVTTLVTFLLVLSSKLSCCFTSYQNLPLHKKVDWDTRYGSCIHSIIVTTIAIYTFLYNEELSSNHFWTEAVLARCGISITFGYILADIMILIWCYYNKYYSDDLIPYLVHHALALLAYAYVMGYGYILFFANIRQLAEISSVFVNVRWYLDAAGKPRDSQIFIANGLVMAVTFFAGRILVIPYFFYEAYRVWSYPERLAMGPSLSSIWILSCIIVDVINLYWFGKIARGAVKVLSHCGKGSKENNNKTL